MEKFSIISIDDHHQSNSFLDENVQNLFDEIFDYDNDNEKILPISHREFLNKQNLTILKQTLIDFQIDYFEAEIFDSDFAKEKLRCLILGIDQDFEIILRNDPLLHDIKTKLEPNLQWLGFWWKSYIFDAIDLGLLNKCKVLVMDLSFEQICYLNQILSLYILTSGMEHCLGDLLRLKTEQIPQLMKDLFEMEELNKLIGKDLVSILKLILGPPTTLNFRNILWHGFINCSSIVQSTKYEYAKNNICSTIRLRPLISTLVMIMSTIGQQLFDNNQSFQVIIPRGPMFDLEEFGQYFHIDAILNNDQMKLLESSCETTIKKCPLIHCTMKPMWIYMFKLYQNQNHNQNYSQYSICFLFPLFESLMRYLYCQMNQLEDRLLTAIAREYYVTFREIFGSFITQLDYWEVDELLEESLPKNQIMKILPSGFIHLFSDLILWFKGPRLRDRLSHGQIRFDQLNCDVKRFAFVSVLALIKWINWRFNSKQGHLEPKTLQKFLSYESRFHRIYHIKNQLIGIACKEIEFLENFCILKSSILQKELNHFVKRLQSIRHDISVMFLLKCSFVINFLENLLQDYDIFLNNLKSFYFEKNLLQKQSKLRSRQRENFQQFLQLSKSIAELISNQSWWSMLVMLLERLQSIGRLKKDFDWRRNIWEKRYVRILLANAQHLRQDSLEHRWRSIEMTLQSNRIMAIEIIENVEQKLKFNKIE